MRFRVTLLRRCEIDATSARESRSGLHGVHEVGEMPLLDRMIPRGLR
jgi:hypothetical protein